METRGKEIQAAKEDKYLVRQTGIDLVHILAEQGEDEEEAAEDYDPQSAMSKEEETKEKVDRLRRICKSVKQTEPDVEVMVPLPQLQLPQKNQKQLRSSSSSRKSEPCLSSSEDTLPLGVHKEIRTAASISSSSSSSSNITNPSKTNSSQSTSMRQRNNPISDEQSIISETEPLISSHKNRRNPRVFSTSPLRGETRGGDGAEEEGKASLEGLKRDWVEQGEEKTIRTVLKDLFSGGNPHNYESLSPGMTIRTTWLAIFLGQVLSGILCVSAITSVYLTDTYKIHVPNAQNFAFYITLATVFTTILACRPADRNLFPVLKTRGWKYALVALADAEANFLVVKAYQYTTLTSVQLLDCFTIPTVLSLSWLVLRIRYKVAHILGVSICLLGVCCLVWADIEEGRPIGAGKDRFLGDMLCLAGAFLYGVSNVAQEFVVKTFDIVEFLGMVGLFGSFVSGAQTVLLEYGEVTSANWGGLTGTPVFLLVGFASAQLTFYLVAALVMKLSGATVYNLSILTADFYSLIVGIYLFQYKFHALYFLSFVLVMTGVIVFSIKPTIIASHIYRSLVREHTTTVDLELMASTPPPSSCPYSASMSDFPGNGSSSMSHGMGNAVGSTATPGLAGSLLDTTPSPDGHHGGRMMSMMGMGEATSTTNTTTTSFLSSQNCDVVLQTGIVVSGGGGGSNGSNNGNNRRTSERYKDTRQMYETNGTYVIPEDEVC